MTRIIEHGQNPAPGDGLLARFGPDAALPDVLTALAHARRGDFSQPCGTRYTDLAKGQ